MIHVLLFFHSVAQVYSEKSNPSSPKIRQNISPLLNWIFFSFSSEIGSVFFIKEIGKSLNETEIKKENWNLLK